MRNERSFYSSKVIKENKSGNVLKTIFLVVIIGFIISLSFLFSILYYLSKEEQVELISSENVEVYYVNKAKYNSTSSVYDVKSNIEIFTKEDTVIIQGSIKNTRNIKVNYNNKIEEYYCLIEIKVDEIIVGEYDKKTCKILLYQPVDLRKDRELRSGKKGIFVVSKYSSDYIINNEGGKFVTSDLADGYLIDEQRYLFIQSFLCVKYAKWQYKDLQAKRLKDVKEYIIEVINKEG